MAVSRLASQAGLGCIGGNSPSITHPMASLCNVAVRRTTALLESLVKYNAPDGQAVASLRYCHAVLPVRQFQCSAVVGLEQNRLGSTDDGSCGDFLALLTADPIHEFCFSCLTQTTNLMWWNISHCSLFIDNCFRK